LRRSNAPQIISLTCKGTEKFAGLPEDTTEQSLVVNLTDGTVSGSWGGPVAHITNADDASIEFSGKGPASPGLDDPPGAPTETATVRGTIDRVTGRASVFWNSEDGKTSSIDNLTRKATNRQFRKLSEEMRNSNVPSKVATLIIAAAVIRSQ
jgi:hypothetical protein